MPSWACAQACGPGAWVREELSCTRQAETLDGVYEALADGDPESIAASVAS